ncbi:MAG TPA: DUF2934 domain-containing protein [Dehalococcoidia bacterium]|nr:DUF2934 domain-containing protein [Dehalococcoidia bacterium]
MINITSTGDAAIVAEEQIMALAYTLWEQEDCPEGKREEKGVSKWRKHKK